MDETLPPRVGSGIGYVVGESIQDGTFEPGISFETGLRPLRMRK